jgi:hypothetical protein
MVVSRETLLAMTAAFIRVMSGGTTEEVMSIRSPRCVQRILPSSLQASVLDNERFAAFYTSVSKDFSNFQVYLAPGMVPIVDVVSRRVVLHLRARADGPNGLYENEYIFMLHASEDGALLEEVIEFTDSGYTRDYFQPKQV